jgi:hypothetical protein
MPILFELKKYWNPIFIETGTYMGCGVKKALEAEFEEIYSIEIDPKRYEACKKMFKDNSNVHIIFGDSSVELPKLLQTIDKKVTFWIDAHYCGDGSYLGHKWSPIKEELETIKQHHIKNHTILIDDWRCMDNTHIDYTWKQQVKRGNYSIYTIDKSSGKEVGFLGKEKCFEFLKQINENYSFSFENGEVEDDVLVCQIDEIKD